MGGSAGGPTADGEPTPPDRPLDDGGLVIPDDASALDADRLAWLAEERAHRRRERLERLALVRGRSGRSGPGPSGGRLGGSGPIVVACLAAVALVGTLVVVVVPSSAHPQLVSQVTPQALADVPPIDVPAARVASPGAGAPSVEVASGAMVGRRLPETVLVADTGRVRTTELRPAVILLIPPSCGCTASVAALHRQAEEFRLPVWLVSAGETPPGRAQLVRLDTDSAHTRARWAQDPGSVLHRAMRARGLTVVLVASDGVVASVVRNIPAAGRGIPALELVLALLASPPE